MPSPQSCRSCRWFVESADATFDYGRCEWPAPPLPDSITIYNISRWVAVDDGRSCPTWEPAETESRT